MVAERDIPGGLDEAWRGATCDPDALDALGASRRLFGELPGWQGRLVVEALRAGATWEEIGAALGTTRQAAWARFRDVAEATDEGRSPMTEQVSALQRRLSDDVRSLQARLKAADAEWREDRKRLQHELRTVERKRGEQRAALQQELRDTADAVRAEIRALRVPPG